MSPNRAPSARVGFTIVHASELPTLQPRRHKVKQIGGAQDRKIFFRATLNKTRIHKSNWSPFILIDIYEVTIIKLRLSSLTQCQFASYRMGVNSFCACCIALALINHKIYPNIQRVKLKICCIAYD